jgi:hypothetical protein
VMSSSLTTSPSTNSPKSARPSNGPARTSAFSRLQSGFQIRSNWSSRNSKHFCAPSGRGTTISHSK